MNIAEKFNQDIWYVLEKIYKKALYSRMGNPIKYELNPNVITNYSINSEEEENILYKLQEWKAIKIVDDGSKYINEYYGGPHYKVISLWKDLEFNKYYNSFEKSFKKDDQKETTQQKEKPDIYDLGFDRNLYRKGVNEENQRTFAQQRDEFRKDQIFKKGIEILEAKKKKLQIDDNKLSEPHKKIRYSKVIANKLNFYSENADAEYKTAIWQFKGKKARAFLTILYQNKNMNFSINDIKKYCNPHIDIKKHKFRNLKDITDTLREIRFRLKVKKGEFFPIFKQEKGWIWLEK